MLIFENSLHDIDKGTYYYKINKLILQLCSLTFHPLRAFHRPKVFKFSEVNYQFFSFMNYVFGIISKTLYFGLSSKDISLHFFLKVL